MRNRWAIRKLGAVCNTIQDGAHESPQEQFDAPADGRFLYITSKNIRTNFLDLENVSYIGEQFHNRIYPRCQPHVGDVLLTKDGANTGNVALNTIDEPFSLLSSVCLIKTNPALLMPAFLCYYLQSPDGLKSITGQMTGAAIKRIILRDIKLATIPLPPLVEQQRIVGILDKALEGITTAEANAEKNLQNARAIFESNLQFIFSERGKGWKQTPLGSLCKLISGQHIDANDYNVEQRGVGYLTGPSDFGFAHPVVAKWTEHPKRMAKSGDILVTVKGSGVGKINLLDVDDVAISRQLMAVRVKAADVSYIYAFLSTKFAYFQSLSNGAAIPGISRGDVLNLMCPMPPPGEQPSIVSLIHSVAEETQRLGSIYQRKLAALEALKKSLLHHAFTGQL